MKKIFIIILITMFAACSTGSNVKTGGNGDKPMVKDVHEGWVDKNTYTVHVTGANLEEAMDRAQYQILKDIVNVRMRNDSPYTDIKKIQEEFSLPLKNGRVIKQEKISDGVGIYFEINDEGLKEKFERK